MKTIDVIIDDCLSPDVLFKYPKVMSAELISKLLHNSNLATVVTTCGTYCVVNIVSTAVRANCQCWSHCLIVCSSFKCTSLRLSSFRMCHFLIYLIVSNSCPTVLRACSNVGRRACRRRRQMSPSCRHTH